MARVAPPRLACNDALIVATASARNAVALLVPGLQCCLVEPWLFLRPFSKHRRLYTYIYIYVCVCVCVCARPTKKVDTVYVFPKNTLLWKHMDAISMLITSSNQNTVKQCKINILEKTCVSLNGALDGPGVCSYRSCDACNLAQRSVSVRLVMLSQREEASWFLQSPL